MSEQWHSADADRAEGFSSAHAAEANLILARLPLEDYTLILPQLVPASLRLKQILYEPNEPITETYFVRDGVVSVIALEGRDDAIEVGLIGKEGFAGLPILYETDSMPFRSIVQVEGDAWRLPARTLTALLRDRPAVRHACLTYAQQFNIQVFQSVACNRLHTVEERCARWLLMTIDRLNGDSFEITHEFLAIILGVRRAGVTVAMGSLQSAGIIRYGRGRVTVVDRAALEAGACHCYRITRAADGLPKPRLHTDG
jgi:CRP-like cAMP-binding protein